ncbi:hypothetical protein ACEPPN_011549 [Leptodophora sp. 'Broadleaf-Isolate-01']
MLTNPPPPRGPRGSSPQVRGRGRGGIQKRRTGGPAPRVDRDGDLNMDAAASTTDKPRSGNGRGKPTSDRPGRSQAGPAPRSGGRGSHISDRAKQNIVRGLGGKQANVLESRITDGGLRLQVSGLSESKAAGNPDGGLDALLSFLERKASGLDSKSNRAVKIKKSSKVGDSVFITASPEDIATILKLNNFNFAGAILTIRALDASGKVPDASAKTMEVKDQLRAVLSSRYDEDSKLLNLSSLVADPGLNSMGMFNGSTNTSKIFPALMVVCNDLFKSRREKREAIVSVTLADNGLTKVDEIHVLAEMFPDIKNIDLSRNNLKDLKSLDAWRKKFRGMEHLILVGNPIEAQLAELKDEIMKRYPKLHSLNNVQVRTAEEVAITVAANEAARNPFPVLGPNFQDVGGVGANFVTQYFALYDSNRNGFLNQFYDAHSKFSLAINMTAPRSTEVSVPVQPWLEYTKHSRNLLKINHLNARMNRQYKGVQDIQTAWATLPATRHPDLHTQGDKYVIECQTVSGLPDLTGQAIHGVDGLMITIHGEFEDQAPNNTEKSLRSFSRTFVLGPGAPGGPQIRVVSDMLALRGWTPLPQPVSSQLPPQQQQPTLTPEQQVLQQQEAIATQLTEKTGMTLEYSAMCLNETGWDLEKAFVAFELNKAQLPANAWIGGIPR